NFHLPRSTLMAMVAALLDERSGGAGDGVVRLKALYAEALSRGYRFYSYGDGMLVLP
ncbi:MAG: S-adenosylmethionine:tRNA ribosyltransferase-isomerase, partial [Phycisphaerales bacterium]|nr:S-adenosylmethionine:tRNA ribosyltransferase-isomerase [Phycisphaerales bacterium]